MKNITLHPHGDSLDIRVEKNGTPHYATLDNEDLAEVVEALTRQGFVAQHKEVRFSKVDVADLIRRLASALASATEDDVTLFLREGVGYEAGRSFPSLSITASTSLFAVQGEVINRA